MYSSPFERGSGGPAMRFYFVFVGSVNRRITLQQFSTRISITLTPPPGILFWVLPHALTPALSQREREQENSPPKLRGVCFGIQSSAGCRTQIESHALSSSA